MHKVKQRRLEAKGWRFGSVSEFLALSEAEAGLIEVKLKLARSLRTMRKKKGLGQVRVARLIGSS